MKIKYNKIKSQSILYFITNAINKDIINLITSLQNFSNSDIDLEVLKKRYIPNIINSLPKKRKLPQNKNLKKFKIKIKNKTKKRCTARCWGGPSSVKYNPVTKKWYYGTQCKKNGVKNNYCLMHYKQTLRSYGLSHGDIKSQPPHQHYLKYKKKIIERFNLQL